MVARSTRGKLDPVFPDHSRQRGTWGTSPVQIERTMRFFLMQGHRTRGLQCLLLALNVVCCETAIRLKSGVKRKWLKQARNDAIDPTEIRRPNLLCCKTRVSW